MFRFGSVQISKKLHFEKNQIRSIVRILKIFKYENYLHFKIVSV
jgi:hypothetical protein